MNHRVYIIENLFIGESENMKAHFIKILLSNSIIFLLLPFSMIAAIDFYNKALLSGNKIYYVITYHVLS